MKKLRMFMAMFGVMALVLGLAGAGWADTYTVGAGGDYAGDWAGLQAALTAAHGNVGDDEIRILGGLALTGTGSELSYAASANGAVTVSGGWNSDYSARTGGTTTLDANDASRVLHILSPATVEHLTVTGGYQGTTGNAGAGIRASATVTLSNLIIHNNINAISSYGVAGVALYGAADNSVVEYCTIHSNVSSNNSGYGGMWVSADDVLIANTIFRDNSGVTAAGAIGVGGSDDNIRVFGSLFYGNELTNGTEGSAIFVPGTYAGNLRFLNSTFADNKAGFYGIYNEGNYILLRNSIISQNGLGVYDTVGAAPNYFGINYSVIHDATTTISQNIGNVSGDPGFVDRGNEDYRLLLQTSNAVDIGTLGINTYFEQMTAADMATAFGGAEATYQGWIDLGNVAPYYVPFSGNGVYDAGLDIIVDLGDYAGSTAGNDVYTTDLAGNPRVYGGLIDAGAYEYQPLQNDDALIPEPASLGLLGLALLGLRKRRN